MSETDPEDELIQFGPTLEVRLSIQSLRQIAFRHDCYELGENEGFACSDCDWQGLSAPIADSFADDNGATVKCPACGVDGLNNDGDPNEYLHAFYETWETYVDRLQYRRLDGEVMDHVTQHADRIREIEAEHGVVDLTDD